MSGSVRWAVVVHAYVHDMYGHIQVKTSLQYETMCSCTCAHGMPSGVNALGTVRTRSSVHWALVHQSYVRSELLNKQRERGELLRTTGTHIQVSSARGTLYTNLPHTG